MAASGAILAAVPRTSPLCEAMTALNWSLDVPALAGAAADLLARLAGCRRFSVLVYDSEADRFSVVWPVAGGGGITLPGDTPILGMVLSSGQSFRPLAKTLPTVPWGNAEARVAACEPLLWGGQPFALLVLHEFRPDADREELLAFAVQQIGCSLGRLLVYQDACREAADSATKLQVIEALGEALSEVQLDRVLARILELSLRSVSAEVGGLVLREDGQLVMPAQWGLDFEAVAGMLTGDGSLVVERVIESGQPVLIPDTMQAGDFDLGSAGERMRSLLCVPLHTRQRKLGALVVVNTSPDRPLSHTDVDLLGGISGLAATMIENAILHREALARENALAQMRVAADIQRRLLPRQPPRVEGLELAGWSDPCDETGGDYFDFVPIGDGRLVLIVGDVTDHGVGAALLMTTARAFLRAMLQPGCDLPAVLGRVNALLRIDMNEDRFMTLFAGEINARGRVLHYVSAGHEPPLLYRAATGEFDKLVSTALPLGVMETGEFPCAPALALQPGDVMVVGTDGIWEARNPGDEQYGHDRLREIVRRNAAASAEQLAASIREELSRFRGAMPQADDATALVVKVL
jgi:sigma-B regulation protein RsbU (phosphoserine phosphatase)